MKNNMKEEIRELKKLVSKMESYIYCDNYNNALGIIKDIKDIADRLNKEIYAKNNDDMYYKNSSNIELIATVPFLYKPVIVNNYYEGDYLERFAEQRTDELKNAEVIEVHDKFWTFNSVEKGNVFGSIPKELISDKQVDKLLNYGWKDILVDIYEVNDILELNDLEKLCKKYMKHFLIVSEVKNNDILVLEYKE